MWAIDPTRGEHVMAMVVDNEHSTSLATGRKFRRVRLMVIDGERKGEQLWVSLVYEGVATWTWKGKVTHPAMLTVGSTVTAQIEQEEFNGQVRSRVLTWEIINLYTGRQ